jgi:hypothetical protein
MNNDLNEKQLIMILHTISDLSIGQATFLVTSNPNYWDVIVTNIVNGYIAIKDAKNICKRMEIS